MGSGADPQKIAAVAAYLPRGFPAATVDVIDANRPDELGKYYRVIQGGNMVCRLFVPRLFHDFHDDVDRALRDMDATGQMRRSRGVRLPRRRGEE